LQPLQAVLSVCSRRRSFADHGRAPSSELAGTKNSRRRLVAKRSRIVKEQLVIILEAIRAAQCTLGRCRQPNVTVEQLRDILCNAGVNRAVRALTYEEASPPTVPEDGLFPHDVAAS
jgi:hypothetical protein